ncbi:MAG: TrkA C-terminal domain-containing protein [Armatimonadota bacterium]
MLGIVGLIAVMVVLGLSLAITRLATVALVMTGLSEESAAFQARSALTGTGFTTHEAEQVVDHPVRRRIVGWLMILRSAGVFTVITSLLLPFGGSSDDVTRLSHLAWLVAAVILLFLMARSKWVERRLDALMTRALERWTDLRVRDYSRLLNLSGNYMVTDIKLNEGDWLVGQTLREADLPAEGVNILGIHRHDGSYVGVPQPDTEFYEGDTVVLYGRKEAVDDLNERRKGFAGEVARSEAVSQQESELSEQEAQEREHERKREQEETDKR